MDKLIEVALIFMPQVLFIFLLGAFYKQDMASIFYISDRDDIKTYKFTNHLYLFIGLGTMTICLFPVTIIQYLKGTITDFYDVGFYILAANGIVFLLIFLFGRFTRTVFYREGVLYHKKLFGSTAFDIEKIDEIRLEKGFITPDVVSVNNKREIKVNVVCFNVNTLLYLIAKTENKALTKTFVNELYQSNGYYKKETESLHKLLEVVKYD